MLKLIKFIFTSIAFMLVLGTLIIFGNHSFNKHKNKPTSTEVKNTTTNTSPKKNDNTTNILLFGDNTDPIMIASINEENNNVDITPVESLSCVDTSNKEKLFNSIEKSTHINLDKFIQINMKDLMDALSVIDNITVDIKKDDLQLINNLIPRFYAESMDSNKGKMTLISSAGVQQINNYQFNAYTTVMSQDKQKQKEAILSFIKNCKDMNFSKYIEIFNTLKPHITTNLTFDDIIKLIKNRSNGGSLLVYSLISVFSLTFSFFVFLAICFLN